MMEMVHVTEMEPVSSATNHSHDILSYFDTGLQLNPLDAYHSSRSGMTDVLPSRVSTGTEVKYLPVESSPSVITLLHDKLDSQSQATIVKSIQYLSASQLHC